VRAVSGGVPGPAPRFSCRQGSRGRGARPRRARRARGRGRRRRAGAMRITPDLVAQSPQFTNPLNDREIKLRAYKIPAVENLGATQDQFDVIDLSDNEIRKLEVRCPPQQPPLPALTGRPPRCAPAGAYAFRGVLPSSVTLPTGRLLSRSLPTRTDCGCMRAAVHQSVYLRVHTRRQAVACCPRLRLTSWPLHIIMLTGVPARHLHRGFLVFLPAWPVSAALPVCCPSCLRAHFLSTEFPAAEATKDAAGLKQPNFSDRRGSKGLAAKPAYNYACK
jgi:hypothetical protein